MAIIRPQISPPALPAQGQRVLYVGNAADDICAIVTQHVGELDVQYETSITGALMLARSSTFDTVIIDHRNEELATKLIVPLFSSLGFDIRIIVISDLQNVRQYLAVPGVARVLTTPLRASQLLRVLGLKERPKHFDDTPKHHTSEDTKPSETKAPRNGVIQSFFNWLMTLVSTLYKRAAFVLLLALFMAFAFYGLLIGYFLLSSSWGAPMSLAPGHELVAKTEREFTELTVAYSQSEQKISEASLEYEKAAQELNDATVIVSYASGTIAKEIKNIQRRSKSGGKSLARLEKVHAALTRQLETGGAKNELEKLYANRLIDKKTYSAGSMNALDLDRKVAELENEIEREKLYTEGSGETIAILQALKKALDDGGPVESLAASSPELLLLTKQAVDGRAAQTNAKSILKSSQRRKELLEKNSKILLRQINQIEASVLGRAMTKPIDVVFVPYSNTGRFSKGTPLFSCAFTVVWCKNAGVVGNPLPGEINAVHPFFGKPIRGYFVEALLNDPTVAEREIIHGVRAPFFF